MKNFKVSVYIVMLILTLMLTGCASNDITPTIYKTMYIAGSGYDTGMKTVASLQKQGIISTEQRLVINEYANKFYAPYQIAAKSLSVYNKTKDKDVYNQLTIAITEFIGAWPMFADSINRFQPGLLGTDLPKIE